MPRVVIALVCAVAATGLALGLTADAGDWFGGSPVVLTGCAAGAISTVLVAAAVRRVHPQVSLPLFAGAGTMAGYALLLGAGARAVDAGGWGWVVRAAEAAHVPALTLLPVAVLVAVRAVGGGDGRRPLLLLGLLAGLAAAALVLFNPSAAGPALVPGGGVVAAGLNSGWLLALVASPVLPHRAARDAAGAPGPLGAADHRLVTLAVVALVPAVLIATCTLFAALAGGLPESVVLGLLFGGLGLAWPLTAAGAGLAVRGPGEPYTVGAGVLLRAASLLIALTGGALAVTVAVAVAASGPGRPGADRVRVPARRARRTRPGAAGGRSPAVPAHPAGA